MYIIILGRLAQFHSDKNVDASCFNDHKVCVWYRPPNSSACLFDKINNVFDKIETLTLEVILLGDLTCDVSSKNPNAYTKRLLEFAENYHLTQLIDKPTRVTRSSSTITDLEFTSDSKKANFVMLYTSDSVITT